MTRTRHLSKIDAFRFSFTLAIAFLAMQARRPAEKFTSAARHGRFCPAVLYFAFPFYLFPPFFILAPYPFFLERIRPFFDSTARQWSPYRQWLSPRAPKSQPPCKPESARYSSFYFYIFRTRARYIPMYIYFFFSGFTPKLSRLLLHHISDSTTCWQQQRAEYRWILQELHDYCW